MNHFKNYPVWKKNALNLRTIKLLKICVIMAKINACGEKMMCEDLSKLVKLSYTIKYLFNLV